MSAATITNKAQPFRNFSPRDLPGCAMWFDASGATNFLLDASSNVQEWYSRGAQPYTLRQTTSSNRPFYDSTIPGVVFGTSISQLTLSQALKPSQIKDCLYPAGANNFQYAANGCIFGVLSVSATASDANMFTTIYTNGTSGVVYPYLWRMLSTSAMEIRSGGYFFNNPNQERTGTLCNLPINQRFLLTHRVSGVGVGVNPSIYLNGQLTALSNLSGQILVDNANATLQCYLNGQGCFNELIVYNTLLPDNQRQLVEMYLARKWNTPLSNVDVTNPYRNYLPYVKFLSNLLPTTRTPTAWFDMQDSSTLTFSGNTLSLWRSKYSIASGVCFSALYDPLFSNSASSAPVYSSNGLNGFPALGFVGTASTAMIMTTSTTFFTADCTHILVASLRSGGSYFQRILQLDLSGENPTFSRVLNRRSATQVALTNFKSSTAMCNINVAEQPLILTVEESSSNNPLCRRNLYVNGYVFTSSVSSQNASGATISSLVMGGPAGIPYVETVQFSTFLYTSISLGEWIMFYPALSQPDRLAVESYLADKWNITLSFGRNNPIGSVVYAGPSNFDFNLALSISHSFFSNTGIPRPVARSPLIFTPGNENNLALWLDAADPSTINVTGSTITWLDKSPQLNHFSNMSGTYFQKGNIQPYMPSIQDASGYSRSNSPFTGSNTSIVMFMVSRATANGNCLFTTASSATQAHYFTTNSGGYGAGIQGVANIVPQTTTNPVMQSLYSVGPANILRYDVNVATLSTTGALNWATAVTPFNLTKVSAGYEIGEIMVFQLSGNRTFWASVEGYLAWKWGLQGYLPSNHPYYSARP